MVAALMPRNQEDEDSARSFEIAISLVTYQECEESAWRIRRERMDWRDGKSERIAGAKDSRARTAAERETLI